MIVSNSAGTPDDKDGQQAQAIEHALQVNVLRHQEKKPSGGEELLKHFSGIKAGRIAIVGDRALTDVVFGNNYGMLTILTRDVVTEEGDNPMALRVSFFLLCLCRKRSSKKMQLTLVNCLGMKYRFGGWNIGCWPSWIG